MCFSAASDLVGQVRNAERVIAAITSQGGTAIAVQANIAKETDIRHLSAEAKKAVDRVDILVNNAGIYEFAALENEKPEHFHRCLI